MGTLIKMADGEEFRLSSPYEGMFGSIAGTLDRKGSAIDMNARPLPRGFAVFTLERGDEVLVNCEQIVSVRKT